MPIKLYLFRECTFGCQIVMKAFCRFNFAIFTILDLNIRISYPILVRQQSPSSLVESMLVSNKSL